MERQDIIRKSPGSACSSEPQSVTGRHTERNKSASERDGGRDSDKAEIKRKRDRDTYTKLQRKSASERDTERLRDKLTKSWRD